MRGLDFSIVAEYWPLIGKGLWWTTVISSASAALSIIAGIAFALLVLYAAPLVRYPVRAFMWLFMGTPLLLQLFLIYFGLVQVGIDIRAIWSGIIGLGLHFAVYNADIFRAGIASLDSGQTEAGRSLGFGAWQARLYIVVPQALHNTMPAIGNMMVALLKESSIVSMIGITDLVHSTQLIISETYRPFELYMMAAALYYGLNIVLEVVLRGIEQRAELSR